MRHITNLIPAVRSPSLWWAVVTLTAVGYGHAYAVTVGGRVFTFVILICGMGIVAVPASLIAGGLTRALEDERAARRSEPEAKAVRLQPFSS